jgi:hypothetical protein
MMVNRFALGYLLSGTQPQRGWASASGAIHERSSSKTSHQGLKPSSFSCSAISRLSSSTNFLASCNKSSSISTGLYLRRLQTLNPFSDFQLHWVMSVWRISEDRHILWTKCCVSFTTDGTRPFSSSGINLRKLTHGRVTQGSIYVLAREINAWLTMTSAARMIGSSDLISGRTGIVHAAQLPWRTCILADQARNSSGIHSEYRLHGH